ncbi:MAG: recombination regulator RecX [Thiotrichales bacterium]|nr:MAG: recombination regulator RecX [Thiotrichales bacterium]
MGNNQGNFSTIYNSAIRLLAIREHSKYELQNKLFLKFKDSAAIQNLLTILEEKDYQSQARFLEVFVRSKVIKGYGPKKITAELIIKHKIPKNLIVKEFQTQNLNWQNIANQVLKKHLSRPANKHKSRQQLIRFMLSRGFSTPNQLFS